MSLRTWKAQYLGKVPKPPTCMSKKQAIYHSIQKWSGLDAKSLAEHELYKSSKTIREFDTDEILVIDSDNCALCIKYWTPGLGCEECPIFKENRRACNKEWYKWIEREDTEPMLTLLRSLKGK